MCADFTPSKSRSPSDSKSVNGEKGVEETAASFYSSLAGIYVIHGWFDWDNVVLFFDLYTIKEMQ